MIVSALYGRRTVFCFTGIHTPYPNDWWDELPNGSACRFYNCAMIVLRTLDMDEIAAIGEHRLLAVPNLGRKTIRELKAVLAKYGRELAP